MVNRYMRSDVRDLFDSASEWVRAPDYDALLSQLEAVKRERERDMLIGALCAAHNTETKS